ncbi:hypothetical protein [Roseomonas sp. HF4]|nr:hypothetical protein [Roseomonas sp. HF4]
MSTDDDHVTHRAAALPLAAAFIAAETARFRPVVDSIRPELDQ